MRISLPRSAAAVFVATALALAGCSAGTSTPGDASGAPQGDAAGATGGPKQATTALSVNTSFVLKGLDPHAVFEGTGIMTVHALYDTLMTFEGEDFKTPVGNLAESFEASEDAKTHTFTLRDGLKFSDGSPLTSADVVFSLNRLKNLKGSPSSLVADMSFEAPDEKTVVVTSETADPYVPTTLAMDFAAVVNSKAVQAKGGTDAEDASTTDSAGPAFNQASMGSGPYELESFDVASRVVLKANPNYWGEKPVFPRVVISNMEVQNQKLTMEKGAQATLALDLSGTLLEGLPADVQVSGSEDTYYFLRFDADPAVSEVSANNDFVKAFRASMDFEGIAKLFGDTAKPAAGVVPTAFAGALPESEAQKRDLEAAKKHLADSGLSDPRISMLYPAMTYRGVDLGVVAAKIQADAKEAGIDVQLEPAPIASFLDKRRAGKVPLSFSPQSFDTPVAVGVVDDLMPGGPVAEIIDWDQAHPELEAAAEKVRGTIDPEEQLAALQDWQRVLNVESPYITLSYNSGVVAASPDLSGAVYAPAGWIVDLGSVGLK